MALSKKSTLIDLFKSVVENDHDEKQQLKRIEIPAIQRDYAQGRNLPEVTQIRHDFLDSLYDALIEASQPIVLDFVYGDIDSAGTLVPLDGQQRLTTLFLLHWYVGRHEYVPETELGFLRNFSYETRYSAREFWRCLIRYTPDFSKEKLSDDISDQSWMAIDWLHDPTIASMLNMLDDIHRKFRNTEGLWAKLNDGAISFYFLSITDMGLTDELYIKMNSRGKPLTPFEHLKAKWEGRIQDMNPQLKDEISRKIDTIWTDIIWPMHDERGVVDNEFVKYFRFLCDVARFRNGLLRGEENLLNLAKQMFGPGTLGVISDKDWLDNVKWIEKGFDCWKDIDIPELFAKHLSYDSYEAGKCVAFKTYRTSEGSRTLNFFEACCRYYGEWESAHVRKFPIGGSALLYAFVFYLMNKNEVTEDEFSRRVRMINNLIKVSEYELREDEGRVKGMFAQIEQIILTGDVDYSTKANGFNLNQRIEEHEKVVWLNAHPEDAEYMFKLEDHPFMWGAVRAVGVENVKLVDRLYSLFACDRALVDRALLTCGDYSMRVRDHYQFGSSRFDAPWRQIFRNKQDQIGPTHDALISLLAKEEVFDDAKLQTIIDQYLAVPGPFDWRRYLIKYDTMHLQRYGMYRWKDGGEKNSYEILAMWTEKNISGRNWNIFLKALYEKIKTEKPSIEIALGEFAYQGDGDKLDLVFAKKFLGFDEGSIKLYEQKCGVDAEVVFKELETINIPQQNGIDTEDRVELAYRIVLELMS